ncbi:hypothetical protein AX15_004515 [Amanita polypyramis BW_CC]|nr:hypothetical protein AX15_004515 [Amanita polypyramis BW_CC]
MSLNKTTTSVTAQLVTLESSAPFAEVTVRLDRALNKEGSKQIMSKIKSATSKDEIEQIVNTIRGDNDFLYFFEINHQQWRNVYEGRDYPATVVYTIGNPLIAHTILKRDIRAALNVPLRLLVVENPETLGTSIIYQLPSSVMVLKSDQDLRAMVEDLDKKLENMLMKVM